MNVFFRSFTQQKFFLSLLSKNSLSPTLSLAQTEERTVKIGARL